MARTKRAASKAAVAAKEVKAVEVSEKVVEAAPAVEAVPVAEEKKEAVKKPGRKPSAKKASEKKPVEKKTTAKKTAAKKTTETQVNLFVQFNQAEVSYADLIEKAKVDSGIKTPEFIKLYVKPEENMVYYNVDDILGGFALS